MVFGVVKGAAKARTGVKVSHRERLPRVRCEGSAKAPPMTAEQQAEMEKAMQDPEVRSCAMLCQFCAAVWWWQ